MDNHRILSKIEIRRILMDEGFDEVGFASVETNDSVHEHLGEWLGNGYHAGMTWMESNIDKRKDIRLVLPSAKTVIVCLLNYATNINYENNKDSGKISRYAWGNDYHNITDKMLKASILKLKHIYPDADYKHYTDTGPILEKVWAVRAGLGWQAKNSLLINQRLGSYCFISIIITNLEMEADNRIKEYCGSCTACIDNCPTSAITKPGVINSTKCISYWTIETKPNQDFPTEIAQNLNGWIFGCDICQEVCPWNSKVKPTTNRAFYPREKQTTLSIDYINKLDEEQFRLRFKNSPIKRAKLAGLQRNAGELINK